MLDPGDLAHDPLQGLHRHIGDLLGGGTRVLHQDVDHGHRDLRVLLAWGHGQAQDPHQQHRDIEERRERGADEGPGGTPGDPQVRLTGGGPFPFGGSGRFLAHRSSRQSVTCRRLKEPPWPSRR